MIFLVVEPHRNFGFRYFIADRGGDQHDRFHLLDPELLQRGCRFAPGSYVFTLDDLLPAEVEAYEAVWNQLGQHAPGVRLLNHPRHTMGRLALLQTLYNSGRSRIRAVRATEPVESLRYPVFVREEVRHTGSLTPLIRSPDEVRRTLRNLALRGFRRGELLVVEFCDTSDSEGVIRKYSAYIVGDRVIPRALEFGTNWTVKHDPHSYTPERIIEEREFVEKNPHEAQLREIFSLANVQYGRIDYAMIDGALQIWEINLNPTIGRNRPETEESAEVLRVRGLRRPTGDIFYSRFLAAWDALDAPTAIGDPVCVEVDPRLWKAAHRARAAALRGARYQRAMQWATHQPTLGATWQLLKRLRPPVRSQLTDDQTEGS